MVLRFSLTYFFFSDIILLSNKSSFNSSEFEKDSSLFFKTERLNLFLCIRTKALADIASISDGFVPPTE